MYQLKHCRIDRVYFNISFHKLIAVDGRVVKIPTFCQCQLHLNKSEPNCQRELSFAD